MHRTGHDASGEHLLLDGESVGGVGGGRLRQRQHACVDADAHQADEHRVEQDHAEPLSEEVFPAVDRLRKRHVNPAALDIAADAAARKRDRDHRQEHACAGERPRQEKLEPVGEPFLRIQKQGQNWQGDDHHHHEQNGEPRPDRLLDDRPGHTENGMAAGEQPSQHRDADDKADGERDGPCHGDRRGGSTSRPEACGQSQRRDRGSRPGESGPPACCRVVGEPRRQAVAREPRLWRRRRDVMGRVGLHQLTAS